MIKIKKMTILKSMMAVAMFSMPIALSTFIISSGQSPIASGEPTYVESGLTKFVKKNNDGGSPSMQHIFPNATNTGIQYKDVYNDVSFNEVDKTITLGNLDGSLLELTDNYYFEHADSASSSSLFDVTADKPYETRAYDENDSNVNCYNWINGSDGGKYNCLYTVKLISNIHLTNKSSIVLATVLGGFAGGIGQAGPVIASDYVNIDLNGHTLTIDSDCTLYNYGHIYDSKFDENGKHKGQILCHGTILTPFIVDDFAGGARQFAGTACAATTPFRLYSLPFLSCKVKFFSTSKLRALASLNASNKLYGANVEFIGSDSAFLFLKDQNSYIIKDTYNPFFNKNKITNQTGFAQNFKTYYALSGSIGINSIKMAIKFKDFITVNVDMSEYSFPIPPYVNIEILENSNIVVPLMFDVYPGATIKAHSSSTIHFTSKQYSSIHGGKATCYGGIRVLPQMYPSANKTMDTKFSNYNVEPYYVYEKLEQKSYNKPFVDGKINTKARIVLDSTITQESGNHILAGRINLGENAINSLVNLKGNFLFFDKGIFKYFYADDEFKLAFTYVPRGVPDDEVTVASYTFLPLVSNGKVMFDVENNDYSNFMESEYSFDFSEGVYINNSTQQLKAYITDNNNKLDVTGSIRNIEVLDETNHYIIYNNQSYKYFRNIFLPKKIVENDDLKLKTALNINGDVDVTNNKAAGNLTLTNGVYEQNILDAHKEKKATVGKNWLGKREKPKYPNEWTVIKENNTKSTIKNPTLAFSGCDILEYQDRNGKSFSNFTDLNASIDTFNYVDSNKFSSTINMTSGKNIGKLKITKDVREHNAEQFTYFNGQQAYKLNESQKESYVEIEKDKKREYTLNLVFKEYSGILTIPQGTYTGTLDLYWQRRPNKFLLTFNNEVGHYVLN